MTGIFSIAKLLGRNNLIGRGWVASSFNYNKKSKVFLSTGYMPVNGRIERLERRRPPFRTLRPGRPGCWSGLAGSPLRRLFQALRHQATRFTVEPTASAAV
jgi:hypothetical protein